MTLEFSMHARYLKDLLGKMTLDEKLAQLGSCWIYELQSKGDLDPHLLDRKLQDGIGQVTRLAGASTFDPARAARSANQIQKFLVEQTRLGIPAILHEECCSGAMILGGTMFPQAIGLASSFRPENAGAMTGVIRKQLRAIGAHQGLAPVLDVARDARWGRVEETFGEDATLVSHFGTEYIKGLQGDGLADAIMATGKHFIGHSLSQGGLNCAPVQIGKHELYEVYMAPFQAAIRDARLASIMNAYPELDGEVVAASRYILTELLREELGFDGLVVSDYEAVLMIHTYHHAAADRSAAACMAIKAGIDVELPTIACYGDPLRVGLEAGEINLEVIDRSVSRHLQKKLELGLFENAYVDEEHVLEVFETVENRQLAHEIALQSMVLLKNDGLLPLAKTIGRLAVIGPNANEGRNLLGDYSYPASLQLMQLWAPEESSFAHLDPAELVRHEAKTISVLNGIQAVVPQTTRVLHAKGCENLGDDRAGFDEAVNTARAADVVVLVLGDRSGLLPNCTSGETRDSADLKLPGVQEDLARAIIATGKPVVVVLVNGRPYAIPWLAENASALLEAWLPGEEGGAAIAEILFGERNPGGKLPITFPRAVGQVPIYYNFKPSGMRSNWYVDYVNETVTPLFPFGHGLSYTTFEYADLRVMRSQTKANEVIDISLQVTNSGKVFGEEVTQLYIQDEFASLPRPLKELKGYVRFGLMPGESKEVTFHLPVNQLAFYDVDLKLILEPGRIFVLVGSSSDDIRLRGEFHITGERKIPVSERVFLCASEAKNLP